MILPERVLGSSVTSRTFLGFAIGPISLPTWARSSSGTFSSPPASAIASSLPPRRITKATGAWPVVSSFAPTTAASATHSWLTSADSISMVDRR